MIFTNSGIPGPGFSYPVGVGLFTDVIASNTVFTSFVRGDGGFLSNVNSSIPGTLPNLVISNSLTVTNVFATIYQGDGGLLSNLNVTVDGNTLSNIQASNIVGLNVVYGNTLSNLNASNLAFGLVGSSLILGNTLSNIQSANITQPFTNLVVSNTLTTTNVVAAGFTSNVSNTVFNYTTLSVPYINCTSINVTTTATYATVNTTNMLVTGSMGFATITGTGGTVTQLTSRNTGVTLNKPCGVITLFSSAINSQASNTFTLTNSYIAATDFVIINHVSGQTPGAYTFAVDPNAGTANITLRNVSGGTLSSGAPVLQFIVIKSTNA